MFPVERVEDALAKNMVWYSKIGRSLGIAGTSAISGGFVAYDITHQFFVAFFTFLAIFCGLGSMILSIFAAPNESIKG